MEHSQSWLANRDSTTSTTCIQISKRRKSCQICQWKRSLRFFKYLTHIQLAARCIWLQWLELVGQVGQAWAHNEHIFGLDIIYAAHVYYTVAQGSPVLASRDGSNHWKNVQVFLSQTSVRISVIAELLHLQLDLTSWSVGTANLHVKIRRVCACWYRCWVWIWWLKADAACLSVMSSAAVIRVQGRGAHAQHHRFWHSTKAMNTSKGHDGLIWNICVWVRCILIRLLVKRRPWANWTYCLLPRLSLIGRILKDADSEYQKSAGNLHLTTRCRLIADHYVDWGFPLFQSKVAGAMIQCVWMRDDVASGQVRTPFCKSDSGCHTYLYKALSTELQYVWYKAKQWADHSRTVRGNLYMDQAGEDPTPTCTVAIGWSAPGPDYPDWLHTSVMYIWCQLACSVTIVACSITTVKSKSMVPWRSQPRRHLIVCGHDFCGLLEHKPPWMPGWSHVM